MRRAALVKRTAALKRPAWGKRAAWGVGLLTAAGLVVATTAGFGGAASASQKAPYTDPNAVGYIGLCNMAGHQITSGNINTTPFAWRAVSSQPAAAPYNNDWRTAILLAYQPRQGLVSGEWSGDELTASSRYTNPEHPMAAATGGDDSLEAFIEDFRPVWDGFLELRMYLGTRDAEVYSFHYPVLNIQVTGDTWHAIGGGRVDCSSGTSESIESLLLPKSKTAVTSTTVDPSGSGGTTTSGDPTGGGASKSGGSKPGSGADKAAGGSDLTAAAGSTSHPPVALIALAALVLLAGATFLLFRRRRRDLDQTVPANHRRSPTKGP